MSCDCRNNNGLGPITQMLLCWLLVGVLVGRSALADIFQGLLWVAGGCLALYVGWKCLGLVLSRWWVALSVGLVALYASHEYGWPNWVNSMIVMAMIIGSGLVSVREDWLEPMDIEARQRVYAAMQSRSEQQ